MVSTGWYFLATMIAAYGVANLLQSVAATRTTVHCTFDPGLLLRLASHRCYLVGVGCQMLGFVLAFLARRDLPLFLVQASVAAGLGVTAVLGVVLLRWRLPLAEVVLLGLLVLGIVALVISARPAQARPLGATGVAALAVVLGLIAVAGVFTVRLRGVPGSVALGALAGLAFSAAAVAARPLAAVHEPEQFLVHPLLYLLVVHSLVGQLLLGLAMQRGSTTAAVAAMDAAGAVPAAIVGLLLLGDRIWPGREWLAATGFLVTLAAVIGLTRFAEPQHHHPVVPAGHHGPGAAEPRTLAAVGAAAWPATPPGRLSPAEPARPIGHGPATGPQAGDHRGVQPARERPAVQPVRGRASVQPARGQAPTRGQANAQQARQRAAVRRG